MEPTLQKSAIETITSSQDLALIQFPPVGLSKRRPHNYEYQQYRHVQQTHDVDLLTKYRGATARPTPHKDPSQNGAL